MNRNISEKNNSARYLISLYDLAKWTSDISAPN